MTFAHGWSNVKDVGPTLYKCYTVVLDMTLLVLFYNLVVERGADGSKVTYWYHRQFLEAARERYCCDDITTQKMHTHVAEYFLGKWSNGSYIANSSPDELFVFIFHSFKAEIAHIISIY